MLVNWIAQNLEEKAYTIIMYVQFTGFCARKCIDTAFISMQTAPVQ